MHIIWTYFSRIITSRFGSSDLIARCSRAGGLLAFGAAADSSFRFLKNVILARLLLPEHFGLTATIMAMVAFVETFTDVGLRQSVIQNKKGTDHSFLNVIWWLSSLRAAIIYAGAFLFAPLMASYYGMPAATSLLRVGFLVILFAGLKSPSLFVLEKRLELKRWVAVMYGSSVFAGIVTVIAAFILRNAWAIVVGVACDAFLKAALSYIVCPFTPTFAFDKETIREVGRFSKGIMGLPIMMLIFTQADVFVIGKVVSLSAVGAYVLARNLAELPGNLVSKIVTPILLPAFAEMQDSAGRLRNNLLKVTNAAGLLIVPFSAFLILFSKGILYVVYGAKYTAVSTAFSIFAVVTLIMVLSSFLMVAYISVGRPAIQRNAAFVRTVLLIGLIYPVARTFGTTGVALLVLTAVIVSFGIQIAYAKRVFGLDGALWLRSLLPGAILALVVVVPGLILKAFNPATLFSLMIGVLLCLVSWSLGFTRLRGSLLVGRP